LTLTRRKHVDIHEKLYYNVYDGDEVVSTGHVQGHSFTQLGKLRLAQMLAGSVTSAAGKIDRYRVMLSGPTYLYSDATVVSWDSNGAEGLITAQTDEFTTAGIYLRLEGSQSNDSINSYYHYVTTNITIGSGQSIRFFIEYTFNGLGDEGGAYPAVNGDSVVAALLMNKDTGGFCYPMGSLEMEDHAAVKFSNYPISVSVSNDTGNNQAYLLLSGENWSIANDQAIYYIRVLTSTAGAKHVIHEWSYDGDGDSSGPFSISNKMGAQKPMYVQTDIAFTFG